MTPTAFNPKSTAPCRTVAFSPDGKYLAETNYLGFITIREVNNCQVINRLMGQTTLAETIRFHPEKNQLYIAGAGFEGYRDFGAVKIYEIPSGKRINELKGHTDDVIDICFPDNNRVATVSLDGNVIVHNLIDNTQWIWKEYGEYLNTCTARPGHTGQFAVAGDSDFTYVLDCLKQDVIAKIFTPNDSNGLIWSKDGNTLIVGGDNLDLQYFDGKHAFEKVSTIHLGGSVKKTCYDPMFNERGLAACYDGQVWSFPLHYWDTLPPYVIVENRDGIWGTNVAASNNLVAVPSFGDIAFVFERNSNGIAKKQIGQEPTATYGCNWIVINKAENIVATTHDDGFIRFRNATHGDFIKEIKPPTNSLLMGADFHPYLPIIAVIDFNGVVYLINYYDETIVDQKKLTFGPGITVQFNSTGGMLALGGYGPEGWVIRLNNQGIIIDSTTLEHPNEGVVKSIFFSENDGIIIGSGDGSIVFHEKVGDKWVMVRHLITDMELCNAVVYSEDTSYVFSAARDQTVRKFDAVTGKQLDIGYCHTRSIKSIAISDSGAYLATGSYDRTVIIWDTETMLAILPPLRIANAGISSVKFYSDHIYTCSFDGYISCWNMQGKLIWSKDSIDLLNKK